jgi:hypothetical protein
LPITIWTIRVFKCGVCGQIYLKKKDAKQCEEEDREADFWQEEAEKQAEAEFFGEDEETEWGSDEDPNYTESDLC